MASSTGAVNTAGSSSMQAQQQQQQQQHDASAAGSNLAQVAQGQIMQAALGTMAQQQQQQQPAGGGSGTGVDLGSVLAKIQSLEKEKADMRAQLDVVSGKLSKLQESKRAEMEQMMNSTISKWLENLNTSDAAAKEQLKNGLDHLVQSGDESGVWNVIACASSNWVTNVNQIETLTQQLNEYREKERLLTGGIFQSEESRVSSSLPGGAVGGDPGKRKFDSISQAHGATSGQPGDIWSEFQSMMMSSGGNRGYDYGIMVAGAGRGEGMEGSGA
jgi:hypothetical protein